MHFLLLIQRWIQREQPCFCLGAFLERLGCHTKRDHSNCLWLGYIMDHQGKILKDRGGLHNRVTQRIYIRPFTLAECKELSPRIATSLWLIIDIAECYMIMGGIPFYLKNVRRGASLSQNVDEMFFADKGRLDDEFNDLYTSLFKKSDNYIKVVQALSTKNKGLTRDEILKATKLESNGHFTTILQDLINCDFIRCYRGYGNKSKMSIYQLTDPFSLFYYKFIKNNGKTGYKPLFWQFQLAPVS